MPLPPAMLFPFDAGDDPAQVFVGACVLRGWALDNPDSSNACDGDIIDTAGADFVTVAHVALLPNETTREWFTGNGILLRTGAYVRADDGSISGTLYLTPISNADDVSFAFGESGPYFVHGGV